MAQAQEKELEAQRAQALVHEQIRGAESTMERDLLLAAKEREALASKDKIGACGSALVATDATRSCQPATMTTTHAMSRGCRR